MSLWVYQTKTHHEAQHTNTHTGVAQYTDNGKVTAPCHVLFSTLLQKKHSKSAFPPYSKRNSKSAVPQNVSSVFHVPPQFWFLFLQKCSDCVQCLVFCTKMNGPTSHSWKEHASMSMIVYTFPWMINNSVLNARDFINESHKAPTESRDCRFRSNQGGRDWWAALGACVCTSCDAPCDWLRILMRPW